jgi:hypothetical protein
MMRIFRNESNPTVLKMALFCQISGMPYAIIELIRLAQLELEEIAKVREQIIFLSEVEE